MEDLSHVSDVTRARLQQYGVRFRTDLRRTFSQQGWRTIRSSLQVEATITANGVIDMAKDVRRGVIARMVRDKGFGFVRDVDTKTEYFFHRSAVVAPSTFDRLDEGQVVTFEEESSAKGPRAGQVQAA